MPALLGVHVFVREDRTFLPRCMDSIRTIADEIIVVDAGTIGNTAKEADSDTEWVLYMDANEAIDRGADQIREILRSTEADAFYVEIEQIYDDLSEEERQTYPSVRLFRRNASDREIESSPLKILHQGFMSENVQRQKAERDLHLIRLVFKEQPDSPYLMYYLGVVHCRLGKPEAAETYLKKALELMSPLAPARPDLSRDLAKLLLQLRKAPEVEQLLRRETVRYPDDTDLLFLLGKTLEQKGFLLDALSVYGQFTEKASKANDAAEFRTFQAFCEMGLIYLKIGNLDEACRYFRDGATLYPNYRKALTGWAETLSFQGCSDEEIAQKLLARKGHHDRIAEALLEIGAYGEVLKLLPIEPIFSFRNAKLRFLCLMKTSRLTEANELLEILLSQADEAARQSLIIDRALCLWGSKQSLPGDFYHALIPEQRQHFQQINSHLSKDGSEPNPVPIPLAGQLIDRAVELRLISIAEALSRLDAWLYRVYAKSLYMHGFVLLAETCFQQLTERGQLDDEGLFMLAELYYDKGKVEQAAVLFEKLAIGSQHFHKSRLAAALCYLEIAQTTLRECMNHNPVHPMLLKDMERIQKSKMHLSGVEWHTVWNGVQRRNAHVLEDDFAMHDSQE